MGFVEPVRERVRLELIHRLSASDLDRSEVGLRRKLRCIGEGTGLFWVAGPNSQERPTILRRVEGARREWTVILGAHGEDEMVPCVGYWLGVRHGKVVANALPQQPNSLLGPLEGEWRRIGQRLLAAGADVSFHSPNFLDGSFLVFAEDENGIRLLQNGRVDYVDRPVKFRSPSSNDLVSRTKHWDLQTLTGFRNTYLLEEQVWRLTRGRYRVVKSRTVHDETWAFDQFATAVRRHRWAEIRRFAPNPRIRRLAARWVERALSLGQTRIDDDGRGFGLTSDRREKSPRLIFGRRDGAWVVERFER